MPSGLSYKIYENSDMSLRDFALKCAKQFNFGYQASNYGDKELPFDMAPKIKVDDYYYNRVELALQERQRWEELKNNKEELEKAYQKYIDEHKSFPNNVNEKKEEIKGRYLDMLKRVEEWPVDGDFECVKAFMIKHLNECIESDCYETEPYEFNPEPINEWIENNIQFAKDEVVSANKRLKKEKEHVKKINDQLERFYKNIEDYEPIKESIKYCHYNEKI